MMISGKTKIDKWLKRESGDYILYECKSYNAEIPQLLIAQ